MVQYTQEQDVLAWESLGDFRRSIDNIDHALIHLLAERFKLTQKAGETKAKYNLPTSDTAREEEQVQRLRALAKRAGLAPDTAESILRHIIELVLKNHEKIRTSKEKVDGT